MDREKRSHRLARSIVLVVAMLSAGECLAQTTPGEEGNAPADETSSKLSFHAYVNQAYGRTDEHQVFGIPADGTSDYRNVALQFRYQISGDDAIVAQFLHERLGRSTLNNLRNDVELELAFYERHLNDTTTVRVGRMQLPLGIYNEIRDVGTLLPFYSTPFSVYLKTFTTNNIEGGLISHEFRLGSSWSLDSDLYYGGWRRLEQKASTGQVNAARVDNALGTQLWLNTPVKGVRFGAAALEYEVTGSLNQVGRRDHATVYLLSADGSFDRFFTRAEYITGFQPFRLAPQVVTPKITYDGWYGQVGYNLTPHWRVNAQAEGSRFDYGLGGGPVKFNVDYALGAGYRFTANVIGKIEAHKNNGALIENEVLPVGTDVRYWLVSLAASF